MATEVPTVTCDCGKPMPAGSVQCRVCAKDAFKRVAKWAVLVGVILSLICQSLPIQYQAPCKTVATILSAC